MVLTFDCMQQLLLWMISIIIINNDDIGDASLVWPL